ncbi:MAG: hypothetical protein AMJ90_09915 [candidate division Zixibacteria bacterium SM23_73_2]|nr:MAG: hypothetical protein AMJ90_09915 [candidate division Zixibacteria bacterium SM23_73_2]
MADISSRKAIRIFGLCTVILWFSYVVYFPPFVQTPNMKGLIDEGYQMYNLMNPGVSKQQLEKRLLFSLYFAYAKAIIMVLAGVIAGSLIYKYKRFGRILAITLGIIMLGGRAFALLKAYPDIIERLRIIYVFLLSHAPLQIIHKDIIAPVFFIFSIVYLCKKSVAQKFT